MKLPPVSLVRQYDTHRLIPAKYSADGDSVLVDIANAADLAAVFDLDNATNDRLLSENSLFPGIGIEELVFGVPYFRIVNAAFCHAHPFGSRFNGPDRGAWYAAFELETAQAEIGWHKWIELVEVDWLDEEATYDDYLSDVSAVLHDIRGAKAFTQCLDPASYVASQDLAQTLLDRGSLGIVYPSVRKSKGTCLACFRPTLVMNVRKSRSYRFRWAGKPTPCVAAI